MLTILRGLVVDGLGQVKLLYNNTGSQVKILADDSNQLIARLIGSSIRINLDDY